MSDTHVESMTAPAEGGDAQREAAAGFTDDYLAWLAEFGECKPDPWVAATWAYLWLHERQAAAVAQARAEVIAEVVGEVCDWLAQTNYGFDYHAEDGAGRRLPSCITARDLAEAYTRNTGEPVEDHVWALDVEGITDRLAERDGGAPRG